MIAGLLVAYGAQENAAVDTVAEVLSGIISGATYRLSSTAKTFAKHFVSYLNKDLLPAFDADRTNRSSQDSDGAAEPQTIILVTRGGARD